MFPSVKGGYHRGHYSIKHNNDDKTDHKEENNDENEDDKNENNWNHSN